MKKRFRFAYRGLSESGFITSGKSDLHHPSWTLEQQRSLTIALVGFSAFLNLYTPQPLLPLFTQIFQTSEVEVSLVVSAATAGVAIAAPWVGILADRIGRKRVIVPALFALILPTLLAASAPDLTTLIVWRFFQGLLMAVIFAVSMAYVGEESGPTGVGKTMSVYISGNVVGGFSGRFLAGLMVEPWGWRWVFVAMAGLTLVGAIAAALWLPGSRHFTRKTNIHQSLQAMQTHGRNPRLLAAYAVGFNILFSIVALFTYVNFYLAAPPFHLTTVALGSIFCVYLLGAILTPIAGQWIDRLGYQMSLLGAIALTCLGALLTFIPLLQLVIAGLALSASGIFLSQSISTSYVGTTAREARSSASGMYVSAYYLGGSLGAIVPGYVWSLGGWPACVGLVLGIQLVTVCLCLRFWGSNVKKG